MSGITKAELRALAEAGDEQALLAAFDEDPARVRRFLTRLTFAPDDACHAAVIACFELLARERCAGMPSFFLEIIRRSLWEMNEEGANNSWSAPERAGAVIAGATPRFDEYFSFVFYAARDEPLFHDSLRAAFALVAAANPALGEEYRAGIEALSGTYGGLARAGMRRHVVRGEEAP